MKWIRTYCGHFHHTTIKQWLIDGNERKDIKLQGDKLIKVLVGGDWLVKKGREPILVSDVFTSSQNYKIVEERIDFYINSDYKAVTHEQYMPLAQSVNNES